MDVEPVDLPEPINSPSQGVERKLRSFNQALMFVIVMAVACGIGLYQTGHLEVQMPSVGQSEPPPLDRGGKVGPLDESIDGIRKKHWWWMQWLD